MHSFHIPRIAILPILKGLITEKLSRTDSLDRTRLGDVVWNDHLALGEAGVCLDVQSIEQCTRHVADFFDLPPEQLAALSRDARLGQWVDTINAQLCTSLVRLKFRPAGRGDATISYFHRADRLYEDAAAAAGLLQGRRRMVSLVSPHSLMGFVVTVLTPALQGIEVLDARDLTPDAINDTLAFGDVIVATPSLWSYMIREGMTAPDNTMGVSFGEAMTRELGSEMRRKGIGVMREFYGSTETGLVGWRDSSTDTFMLFDHWERHGESLSRRMPDGTADLLDAMDFLEWKSDRSFALAGRRDGAVQIGAINVFPDWIASVIASHASVESCVIRVGGTASGANRLIADITLAPDLRPTETVAREIDNFTRSQLAVYERPQIYNFF